MSVSLDTLLEQAVGVRRAAAWTTGLVMAAGAIHGTVSGNDTLAFVIFFGVGGIGAAWLIWLDNRVDKLRAAKAAPDKTPPSAYGGEPPTAPAGNAAADPAVVAAVISLLGVLITAILNSAT